MSTERFKSKEKYRRWNAYRHIHGIKAPRLKRVTIAGRTHTVKHTRTNRRKGTRS